VRKIVHKQIRHEGDGIHVVGDINAAIASGSGPGDVQHVSTRSVNRIVQRGGRSQVTTDIDQEGEIVDGGKETEKEV
jgi:hypothetical protein